MRAVLDSSTLDFLSPRLSPGLELTLPQYVANYELPATTVKPVLMAEFGAPTATHATLAAAAEALQTWQADSCAAGFDGWMLWTWDTVGERTGEPAFWNGQDGSGVLERALAPVVRTDPCAPTNIAFGKPVTASSAAPEGPAANAVDGLVGTLWNSIGVRPAGLRLISERSTTSRCYGSSSPRRPRGVRSTRSTGVQPRAARRGQSCTSSTLSRPTGKSSTSRRQRRGPESATCGFTRCGAVVAGVARDPGLQGAVAFSVARRTLPSFGVSLCLQEVYP